MTDLYNGHHFFAGVDIKPNLSHKSNLVVTTRYWENGDFPGQAFHMGAELGMYDERDDDCFRTVGKATQSLFVPRPNSMDVVSFGDSIDGDVLNASMVYQKNTDDSGMPWLHLGLVEIDRTGWEYHDEALDLFIARIVQSIPGDALYVTCYAYPEGKEVNWQRSGTDRMNDETIPWDMEKLTFRGKEMTCGEASKKISKRWELMGLETSNITHTNSAKPVLICHGAFCT